MSSNERLKLILSYARGYETDFRRVKLRWQLAHVTSVAFEFQLKIKRLRHSVFGDGDAIYTSLHSRKQAGTPPKGCQPGPESGRPDSNRRRPAWEAGILPLNYARIVA